ncbi:hypothetical protein ACFQ48_17795 [Hymenobacter caeli]|uniref:Addiction module toxin RelE n=1 Tax=Hymenobacter caeli TaxID=2735894 RepID=A0ABX2FWH6_9BACT|nr:hypothetical protein [Hymenobacter caeli]NRT20796.1 hypothetical protein [Hymenobacter caeli]
MKAPSGPPVASVVTTANFRREAKPLLKKYRSLKQELGQLAGALRQDSAQGEPLGQDCYKIRIAIASKSRGKSGGARVITYRRVIDTKNQVVKLFLLSIYDKAEVASIGKDEIAQLIQEITEE